MMHKTNLQFQSIPTLKNPKQPTPQDTDRTTKLQTETFSFLPQNSQAIHKDSTYIPIKKNKSMC